MQATGWGGSKCDLGWMVGLAAAWAIAVGSGCVRQTERAAEDAGVEDTTCSLGWFWDSGVAADACEDIRGCYSAPWEVLLEIAGDCRFGWATGECDIWGMVFGDVRRSDDGWRLLFATGSDRLFHGPWPERGSAEAVELIRETGDSFVVRSDLGEFRLERGVTDPYCGGRPPFRDMVCEVDVCR